MRKNGVVVVPEPPENTVPASLTDGVLAALLPLNVAAALSRGTVPPDVPVLTNAAVPSAPPAPLDVIADPAPITRLVDVAAPKTGVTSVGEVARTVAPDPVVEANPGLG
jgi:hypothetical protein